MFDFVAGCGVLQHPSDLFSQRKVNRSVAAGPPAPQAAQAVPRSVTVAVFLAIPVFG
jgi:hypothetical protein